MNKNDYNKLKKIIDYKISEMISKGYTGEFNVTPPHVFIDNDYYKITTQYLRYLKFSQTPMFRILVFKEGAKWKTTEYELFRNPGDSTKEYIEKYANLLISVAVLYKVVPGSKGFRIFGLQDEGWTR